MENHVNTHRPAKRNLIILGIVVLVVILLFVAAFANQSQMREGESLVEGCRSGDEFSTTTGEPCDGSGLQGPCQEGDVFNHRTGEPCAAAQ